MLPQLIKSVKNSHNSAVEFHKIQSKVFKHVKTPMIWTPLPSQTYILPITNSCPIFQICVCCLVCRTIFGIAHCSSQISVSSFQDFTYNETSKQFHLLPNFGIGKLFKLGQLKLFPWGDIYMYICAYISEYKKILICVCIQKHICIHIHTFIHVYIHTFIYINTYICLHTYTHTLE